MEDGPRPYLHHLRAAGRNRIASLRGLPHAHSGGERRRNQFDRLEQLVNLFRAPQRRFLDLEAAISIGIRYNLLPMKVRTDFFPVIEASSMAYITVQLDNKDLQFRTTDGGTQRATVNLLGRITSMTRRTAAVFEDAIQVDSAASLLAVTLERQSIYSKALALAPGTYRLSIIAKDTVGGDIGNYERLWWCRASIPACFKPVAWCWRIASRPCLPEASGADSS